MQATRQKHSRANLFWVLSASSFVGLVLTILPLPQAIFFYWPDWMALVVVYWSMSVPDRVGPWVGFTIGTLLEVLFVRNFGVLGLGLAILAFTVNRASQQLQMLSVWQQTIVVTLFVGGFKLLTGWLYGLINGFTITSEYWYSLLGCLVFWPFVSILLQEFRRSAQIR